MIKVIVSDLDGTLLNDEQIISEKTVHYIQKALDHGLRFIVATGRDFSNTIKVMKNLESTCDYILNSGGEIRNQNRELLKIGYMNPDDCIEIYYLISQYPISILYNSTDCDYYIGTEKDAQTALLEMLQLFERNLSKDELRETKWFYESLKRANYLNCVEEIKEKSILITKIMIGAESTKVLEDVMTLLKCKKTIAVASSFEDNLEITDVTAQKGPVIKEYIEQLGYKMEEVVVFGDSLNDYSMLSMDFGMTVAMENAHPKLKKVAKYVTKSNKDDGVAFFLEKILQ